MRPIFTCICGQSFRTGRLLLEHVAILNPHWPRKSPNDEHAILHLEPPKKERTNP